MKKAIAVTFLALAAVFAGNATAQELKDGSKVTFTNEETGHKFNGGSALTLVAQGKDKSGDGIYLITQLSPSGETEYMTAVGGNKEGAQIGFSAAKSAEATKWILHDNGGGWSIIHAASGENAVIRAQDATSATLARNQGGKSQKWVIKVHANAQTPAPPLVGKYEAAVPANDWHYAEITADDKGLKWTNKAGKSWRLGIQIDGAQPGKSWVVIGEGAPDSYKGKLMEVIKDEKGAIVKLIGDEKTVWIKK